MGAGIYSSSDKREGQMVERAERVLGSRADLRTKRPLLDEGLLLAVF